MRPLADWHSVEHVFNIKVNKMKTTTNILSSLTNEKKSLLTKEVSETIADNMLLVGRHNNGTKVFSPANLWDIQRRRRTPSIRRYSL